MKKVNNIILEGVVGSVAYGLNTASSDVDLKGVYVLPTRDVLSMGFDKQSTTLVHNNPDTTYYEVQRFMELVTGGNPTLLETLYLDEYTHLSPIGQMLIDNRSAFLSTKAVMNAYRGYAFSQAKKLNNRTEQCLDGYDSSLKNRFAKHTRHLARLLWQAEELVTTGTLTVKLTEEQRNICFELGERTASEVVDYFFEQDARLQKLEEKSVLPDKPNMDTLNKLLYEIMIIHGI